MRKLYGTGSSSGAAASRSTVIPTDPSLARIISVDLQEMAPLDGVFMLQGDITSRVTADAIISHFHGESVDLVVSDGAPDVTGLHEIDEYMQSQLILAAVNIASHILAENTGCFVAKIFKAEAYDLLQSQLLIFFSQVQCVKPSSSRARSAEHFIVCKGFRKPKGYKAVFMDAVASPSPSPAAAATAEGETSLELNQLIMPYLHCGDLQPHDLLPRVEDHQAQGSVGGDSSFTKFLGGLGEA